MEPYVGEIRMFAGNFAPAGWALCQGQLMAIQQNTALFSLLGTMYGGNGTSTFGLPNLCGTAPVAFGQGNGLQEWAQGEVQGSEGVTLLTTEMPAHNHNIAANNQSGSVDIPTNAYPANSQDPQFNGNTIYATTAPNTTMNPMALGVTGGSVPHNNMQPYLVVNYIIALQGVFPPRS
ncbi:phage tail protein [Taibaiella soli]|uniref:Phage tail protein n=1 Tax=Taibaiella soli TaxID=1649169 RepID=A0A2W2B2F2_9BACT|nr:tail fiber protein [Taibaiella soli]PZF74454.1 phage tail protein [Taibaiella soli]